MLRCAELPDGKVDLDDDEDDDDVRFWRGCACGDRLGSSERECECVCGWMDEVGDMQRVGGPFPEECRRMDCGEGDVRRGGRVGMLRECIVHVGVEVVDWWVGDGTTRGSAEWLVSS